MKHIKKNTKKNIVKKIGYKKLMGGAAAVLPLPIAHNQSVVISSPNSNKVLIFNELIEKLKADELKFTIHFKGLKLKGTIHKKRLLIGSTDNLCLDMNFNDDYTKLNNLFFKTTKNRCIGIDKSINNSNVDNKSNKNFNKLLLELVDVLNIAIKSKYCEIYDIAQIKSKKCDIFLSLYKLFTRGYGFYNEFGYIFINEQNIKINNTLAFEKSMLLLIYKAAKTVKISNIIEFYLQKYKKDTLNILLKINEILKKLTLYEFYEQLIKFCNDEEHIFGDNIDKFTLSFLELLIREYITNKVVKYDKQYKPYEYNPDGTVSTTQLKIPDGWPNHALPDTFPEFVMTSIPMPKIDIHESTQNNFRITIT